jgi:hypothetical protein
MVPALVRLARVQAIYPICGPGIPAVKIGFVAASGDVRAWEPMRVLG